MRSSYVDFAYVYDELMDNVPYAEWAERVVRLIERYGISKPEREKYRDAQADSEAALAQERNLILDLGCGTGTLTQMLYDRGYDLMGVDLSEDMLNVAFDRNARNGSDILYLRQDMRELDLFCTVGTVISVCDSMNYLTKPADVKKTMELVNKFLFPGGIFIFDFNTVHKYADVIGNRTIAENREDVSFIWENTYHPEKKTNEYDLTLFVKDEEPDVFVRSFERHVQRGYTHKDMEKYLREVGMELICSFDADTEEEASDTSERIVMVARKGERK